MSHSHDRQGTDADPQWLDSCHPAQWRDGDADLPPVRASAAGEACRIVEMLRFASAVDDGRVIISAWSIRRVALRLAEIARSSLDTEDGCGSLDAQGPRAGLTEQSP